MSQLLGSSITYWITYWITCRTAVGPQQGRKGFMTRIIQPLDNLGTVLGRAAKASNSRLMAE